MKKITLLFCLFSLLVVLGCKDEGNTDTSCTEDTPINSSSTFAVTLSFWPSSEVNGTEVPTTTPQKTLEFTWENSDECFVWIRTVSPSAGGGERMNVGNDFSIDDSNPNEVAFTYTQNSKDCCSEFNTTGTLKTFYSHILVEDESTGQTGDPLMVAVTDYRK
jgi:hypothetical protein